MLINKNILKVKVDRFKSSVRFEEREYEKFDFNGNLKSDHIEDLQFTNYTSSNICNKYLKLKEICQIINEDSKQIDKLFLPTETDISTDIPKMNRIYKIINAVNNKEIERKELIIKCMCFEDKAIQFYIRKEDNILVLYLIDLYHIGIEGENKDTGRTDRVGIYNASKKFTYDIKDINQELNKISDKP